MELWNGTARALATTHVHHEIHRSGTLCMSNHIAPLFMLLGCQRCGTSSLYEDIMTHVRGAKRGHSLHGEPDYYAREQHYFATDTWSHGMHHYLEHFPTCPHQHSADLAFTVDATPAYLRKPIVATRIPQVYPASVASRLKFLVILRDPTKRLYAYWDSFVQSGMGVNDFEVWSKSALAKTRDCQLKNGNTLWPPPDTRCDTDIVEGVAAGLYAYQLSYWFHAFEPSRFFLTSLDAYEEDTAAVLRAVAHFVGSSGGLLGNPRSIGDPSNPNAVKVMGAMPAGARTAISKFYHEHNAVLLHLLNNNPHVTYSPSLKGLGIQGWAAP